MSLIVEDEKFLNTTEVMGVLGASRQRFYKNAKPFLSTHHFNAKKTPWYKEADVLALKNGKIVRKGHIAISGILGDWTVFLRSLGYTANTVDRSVEIVTLPEDAVITFGLDANDKYVKRSRMTFANGVPICTWDTYYPLGLVCDFLDEIKQGTAGDLVKRIKEKHGIVVGKANDKYSARITTIDELNLFQLVTEEAVLLLQRTSYTADKKLLVLYTDMILLGSWFSPEHEYEVHKWDNN